MKLKLGCLLLALTLPVMAVDLSVATDHENKALSDTWLVGYDTILIIGGANAEHYWWNQVNGRRVINFAEPEAGIDQMNNQMSRTLTMIKPHIVVIQPGWWDCGNGSSYQFNAALWGQSLQHLVAVIRQAGAIPVIGTVIPVNSTNFMPPFQTSGITETCIAALNAQIAISLPGEIRYSTLPWFLTNNKLTAGYDGGDGLTLSRNGLVQLYYSMLGGLVQVNPP